MIRRIIDQKLTSKTIKKLLISSSIFFFILMIAVHYAFSLSNYPVSFMESQLSFSGEVIKSHYATMNSHEIQIYKYAQLIDYGYLISYGLFIFSLSLYLGKRFKKTSPIQKSSHMIATAGITAAICDAIENAFILLMVSQPHTFNDIYAIIHSFFASIKFALLALSIIWIIIITLIVLISKLNQKRPH